MNDEIPSPQPLDWRQALTVRRSARARYVRLKVHPAGQVELVVPKRFDERHLPAILDEHDSWVLRTLERLGTQVQVAQPVFAPSHIHLPAIGDSWQLEYLGGNDGRYGCREQAGGVLRASGGTAWQPALKRWLARKGRQHLVPWLEQVSEELALPFSGASVRGQKSRWGSCSARRHINLNYALLFLPPQCVRYLFVHELCHTVHLNHSPRYWQLVASKEPDYRHWERELRQAAAQVPPWLHARDVARA
jgi:predicted metal-dependent hydrolase